MNDYIIYDTYIFNKDAILISISFFLWKKSTEKCLKILQNEKKQVGKYSKTKGLAMRFGDFLKQISCNFYIYYKLQFHRK